MNLDVTDGTTTTTFVFLDSVTEKFFQFPASKVKNMQDKSDIHAFMVKKVQNLRKTFHIKVNTRDPRIAYTIEKILDPDSHKPSPLSTPEM